MSLTNEIFDPTRCTAPEVRNYNPYFPAAGEATQHAQRAPDFLSGLLTFLGKSQERNIPRPADGGRQVALMPVAGPRYAAGNDLATLRQIISEKRNVFVIDVPHFIRTEAAELAALKKPRSFQILLLV